MSMSTWIEGFVPADETWKKMKKVYDTCEEAGVAAPAEVYKFFNDERPDEAGVSVDINKFVSNVSPHDGADGYEVDIEALLKEMPHIKKIRFVNSY